MPKDMPKALAKSKASNEPYRKVKITMWDDQKFRALSPLQPSGQALFIYLLTSPFTNIIPGLFKAGRAAMAEELGWELDAFDLALGEAISLGMVQVDTQARVFWIPNAIKHNPPTSVNVIKSWVRAFELLPDCDLKYQAFEALKAATHNASKALGLAFDKAFALATPLPKDKPKVLARPFQIAVNSKQILKDQTPHIAGACENGPSPGESSPQELNDDFWTDDPTVKFMMATTWQPSPDFKRRAAVWGNILDGPDPGYTPQELASFTTYWEAEGKAFHQVQWEQKFSRHLASQHNGSPPGARPKRQRQGAFEPSGNYGDKPPEFN
ncbi:DnaT-like ssDNA-binding domain-containing protein [Serratia aquatilis]|uniref:DnaT-like ssDNA-binding domain-containing protein n=1 Tax=Serratia aquatilis TaxID=1737515 RepID=A0ABV6E9H2_9GAMM